MKKLHATLFVALSLVTVAALADDSALISEANIALSQKDYPAAFSKFGALAQHGNATAQFNLGVFYFNGQGVPKDENQALNWFAKAAAQGHTRALQILQGAAARGNVNAQAALRRIQQPAAPAHASPPPVDDKTLLAEANSALAQKDYAIAFPKFSVLAQHGNATAQFNLGAFYFNGQGVAKDEQLAYEWLARSAAQGNARALQIVKNAAAQGNENARSAYATYLGQASAGASIARQAAPNAAEKRADSAPPTSQEAQRRRRANSAPGFLLGVNLGGTGQLTGINNSPSVGLLAGYAFNESFSVELAYNALYRNANADKFIAVTNPGSTGSFDLNAISLTGQYTYALSDSWSLKGNLGGHSSHFSIKSSTAAASRTGNSSGLVVGLKVQYQASRRLGLRAGFDTYTQSGGITGAISEVGIGVIFGF
jgi:TPR repeat protein